MRIDKISLKNFRQYHGYNSIDLTTAGEKNIVLIGGKNGYGKTNFLISLVWCLYGEDISKIDENFKREIQKEGNYSKFLKGSLNWENEKNGEEDFYVEIELSEIELPETIEFNTEHNYRCKLKRSFNVSSSLEDFELTIDGISPTLLADADYKKIFVNDYIIPVEAAKFVFFDAEKIASWAELSTKEEGSVLNDALAKILGLDLYENLIVDLEIYSDGLRKESATSIVRQQINSVEKGIQHNIEEVEIKENEILELEISIEDLKEKLSRYQSYLINIDNIKLTPLNLEGLYLKKKELLKKKEELEVKFNQLSEIIPFSIAAGKLEEVNEHIFKQEYQMTTDEVQLELIEKNNNLLEKLFNIPPFPNDGDISFSKKIFYAEKAKKIIEEIFGGVENSENLLFEHDLNKSDRDLIKETFVLVRNQSKELFEHTIESFNAIKGEIEEVERIIKRIESDQQDEEVIKYTNNKNETVRKIERLVEEKGGMLNQVLALKKTIDADSQRLQLLLKKIEVSEQKRKKLDKANQYIKTLRSFVQEQKRSKCTLLETKILEELQKLLHKLQHNRKSEFIAAVKAELLPENDGLKITLLDNAGEVRHKESLSQGEKQIYISCLIKAILSLSIQEFPIFIDTPLGRLDDEHIKNILLNYYPDLASQVVIMATNNEIPPSRYRLMQANVFQTYLMVNNNNSTKFLQGYFQSYAY